MRLAVASRQVAGVTGTTTTILEHARRLSRMGWEVHVYGETLDGERIRGAGGVPHRLPGWPWGSYVKRRLFAWLFEKATGGRGFDLVVGHGDVLEQDVLSLHNCVHAAHEAVHGRPLPESSGVGRIHRRILEGRAFRVLIANSELMKREVTGRFGVPPDRVRVIHPGHDPERFRPWDRERLGSPVRRELGVRDGQVLVGLVTSGDFKKRGVGIFLSALGRLPPEVRSRTHALVIGRESRLGPYRGQAAATGLGTRIHFLEPIPEVERCYHALDAYVHPALYEEFGQSVQEAMACGVPVLTSAKVGAAELLQGEARDMLLESPGESELAERMAALIADPGMRRRLAEQGIAACRGNTWDANFKATWACYEALLAGR